VLTDSSAITAVASGAVLRAVNKEQGPKRDARSSYGILRREPYEEFPEHTGGSKYYDPHDGLPYINTVDWVLKLVMGTLLVTYISETGLTDNITGRGNRTRLEMPAISLLPHIPLLATPPADMQGGPLCI
jgi:hypothetical protein